MAERLLVMLWVLLLVGCSERVRPPASQNPTHLKVATDLFWSLQERGYVVSKEKPLDPRHGCLPSEYLARKDQSTFRISVFDCQDPAKTQRIVDHPKSQHVDGLLRRKSEGGIIQRGPLEIVLRLETGRKEDTEALVRLIESM